MRESLVVAGKLSFTNSLSLIKADSDQLINNNDNSTASQYPIDPFDPLDPLYPLDLLFEVHCYEPTNSARSCVIY